MNTHGMIVGAVSPNCCAWQDLADRAGTTTWLPWPAAGTWRDGFASGVTDCGLVAGSAYPLTSTWQPYTAQPVVWDPGC